MRFIDLLRKLKQCFFKTSELEINYGKQIYELDNPMVDNIYDEKIYSEYAKRFHTLHVKLKYWFIVPIISIYKYIFQNYLNKDIPDYTWNDNIKIFNKAFDNAHFVWKKYFLNDVHNQTQSNDEIRQHINKNNGIHMYLNTMRDTVTAVYLDDTAYRELLNIFMFELYKEMKTKYEDNANHLLYNSKNKMFAYELYRMNFAKIEKINMGENDGER